MEPALPDEELDNEEKGSGDGNDNGNGARDEARTPWRRR